MKRDVLFCAALLGYCLFLVGSIFQPYANAGNKTPAIRTVLSQSNTKFVAVAGMPDPNDVFRLVNQQRASRGVPVIRANEKLGHVAAAKARDMSELQYYAHKSPSGKYYFDLMKESNITAKYSCENLDMAFVPDPRSYINDWLTSDKGHRECLLNPQVKEAGYAVYGTTKIDHNGTNKQVYLVVAIHATQLR